MRGCDNLCIPLPPLRPAQMPPFRPLALVLIAAALLVATSACSSPPDLDRVYGDWRPPADAPYPLAVPFDITTKGTRVEAQFSIPPALPGQRRPQTVYVTFRASAVRGPMLDLSQPDSPEMKRSGASIEARARLRREPIPIRLQVWRLEGDERIPVVLQKLTMEGKPPGETYRYVRRQDPIFSHHDTFDPNLWRLDALGLEDPSRYYLNHEIAVVGHVPGRYAFEAEVLDDLPGFRENPDIDDFIFDLLITQAREY